MKKLIKHIDLYVLLLTSLFLLSGCRILNFKNRIIYPQNMEAMIENETVNVEHDKDHIDPMRNSTIYYTLRAELYTRKGKGKLQSFLFDREYMVSFMREKGENATYYDPNLKLHTENNPALSFVYQVHVNNNLFLFPDTLEKEIGFIKSANHILEQIELQVSLQGKIRAIENMKEMRKNWNYLRRILLGQYSGQASGTYIAEIDAKFENELVMRDYLRQYFIFGLLFPPIPVHHENEWQHKSLIEFSDYEDEKFEALITFCKERGNQRIYNLGIEAVENSGIKVEQYKGSIIMQKNEHLPLSAIVEVVFRKEDMAYQWYFSLKRKYINMQ